MMRNFSKDTYLEINSKELKNVSEKYKISKLHFIYILRTLDLINNDELNRFKSRYDEWVKKTKGGGRGDENTYSKNRLKINSKKYLNLIYHNYENKNISYGETLNHLSIKKKDDMVKMFEGIENE